MPAYKKTSCDKVSDFFDAFFKQAHTDIKASHIKRGSEPFYAFTRYIPRIEDFPIPPSTNKYTLIHQVCNGIALALLLRCSKEEIIAQIVLTPFWNMFLQHVIYPYFPTDKEPVASNVTLY